MSVLFLSTVTALAFNALGRAPMQHSHATSPLRPSRIVAYLDERDDDTATPALANSWTKTKSGLSFKDTVTGDGELPQAGEPVSICYTAKVLGPGTMVEQVRKERPLTFLRDSEDTESNSAIFNEAIAGMTVGSSRRVLLPPSASTFALPDADFTLEFEIEVVGVKQGLDAAVFNLGGGMGAPRFRAAFRAALILSFVPDVLRLVGALPEGAATLAHAGDAASVAAAHPVVVDAANQWAANGLSNLF